MVRLALALLVTPSRLGLDAALSDAASAAAADGARSTQSVHLTVQAHLSHRANASLLPPLLLGARAMGACYEHLLRLLCAPLFAPDAYRLGERIARGAFGAVCGCALQARTVTAWPCVAPMCN